MWKMLNLTSKMDFSDQEAMEQFLKYPLLYGKRMGFVEVQVFNTEETGLFYKDID